MLAPPIEPEPPLPQIGPIISQHDNSPRAIGAGSRNPRLQLRRRVRAHLAPPARVPGLHRVFSREGGDAHGFLVGEEFRSEAVLEVDEVGAGDQVRAGADPVDGHAVALLVCEAGDRARVAGVGVVHVGADGDGGGAAGVDLLRDEDAVGFDGALDGFPAAET